MEDIGIFEAKTKFPGLCDQVVRSGAPVQVSRRGKPLVVISPAKEPAATGSGIFDQWNAWAEAHPESTQGSDFPEVWSMRQDKTESPLDD